jgi:phosphoglucosamine mutase
MGEFFGTDGIRGVAGQFPLDTPTIERIGYSLARHLRAAASRPVELLIGGDTRESTGWIEKAFTRGAHAGGARVTSLGVITTPGIAYLTRALPADAGVVVSASHNPYQDNGIKIFVPSGCKIDEKMELAIERDLKEPPADMPATSDVTAHSDGTLVPKYLEFLRDEIGVGLNLSHMKLVIDCANGAAFELAPEIFKALGAKVHTINAKPDGKNINSNCGSLHAGDLQKAMLEHNAHLGLAFDGDADRLLVVDETGTVVDGDHILYILANRLKKRGKLSGNRVVATVMSNMGLEVALAEVGITLVRTRVGDKYVLEELLTGGGSIGGEQSGHVIFPEISLAGDGIITALEVLRALVESEKTFSQLRNGFQRFPQVVVNVPVSRKPPLEEIAEVQAAINAVETKFGKNGRLVVRYSGTENVLRVMVEAADEAAMHHHAAHLADVIKQHIG